MLTTIIPLLTTSAGNCLTTANWQEAGVTTASYRLDALLAKPGYEFLRTLPKLSAYVAWDKSIVLNASLPSINSEGKCSLRSPYDGRWMHYTIEEIIDLIIQLQPQMVILPQGISKYPKLWHLLPETIFPFFPAEDLPQGNEKRPYGVYLRYEQENQADWLQKLNEYQLYPRYVAGDINQLLMLVLLKEGVQYIESDIPASDACQGIVYAQKGAISLSNHQFTAQFEVIDSNCYCPTCQQKLTRAYLHHLLAQTPLLCQRFLVQHNLFYINSYCANHLSFAHEGQSGR